MNGVKPRIRANNANEEHHAFARVHPFLLTKKTNITDITRLLLAGTGAVTIAQRRAICLWLYTAKSGRIYNLQPHVQKRGNKRCRALACRYRPFRDEK